MITAAVVTPVPPMFAALMAVANAAMDVTPVTVDAEPPFNEIVSVSVFKTVALATVPVAVGQALAQFVVPTSTQVPAAVSVWNFLKNNLFNDVVATIA